MARAKRTDRTEARRRYRAELAAMATEPASDEELAPNTLANDALAKRTPAKAPDTVPRPSILAAFRTSFRPVDLRGDLRALPQMLTHWSLWLPLGLAVLSTVVFIVVLGPVITPIPANDSAALSDAVRANLIPYTFHQFFAYPPPAAGAFLLGFLARRASWLGGLILGVVAAACFVVIVYMPVGHVFILDADPAAAAPSAVLFSAVGAALFASVAAWYRRFLNLANPNRGARRPARPAGKPKARPAAARTGGRSR